MQFLPSSVLFCCTMNEIRSPMAEGLMKRYHGRQVFIDSVGVERGGQDRLMIEAMKEIGVDMSGHRAKIFDDLADDSFDVVIALSEGARTRAAPLTRYRHCDLRLWKVSDPSLVEGGAEARMAAYRQLREELRERILDLFPLHDHQDY